MSMSSVLCQSRVSRGPGPLLEETLVHSALVGAGQARADVGLAVYVCNRHLARLQQPRWRVALPGRSRENWQHIAATDLEMCLASAL